METLENNVGFSMLAKDFFEMQTTAAMDQTTNLVD